MPDTYEITFETPAPIDVTVETPAPIDVTYETGEAGPPGEDGEQGPPGVVAATAPLAYDAPTQTVSMPQGGATDGQALVWDADAGGPGVGAWVPATVSSPPGGASGQVQFNDGGAFGGSADFTWGTGLLRLASSPAIAEAGDRPTKGLRFTTPGAFNSFVATDQNGSFIYDGNHHVWRWNGYDRMHLAHDGRLAVGSLVPDEFQLYVKTGSAGKTGAVIDGASGQTAALQEWRNSVGTALARISAGGRVYGKPGGGSGGAINTPAYSFQGATDSIGFDYDTGRNNAYYARAGAIAVAFEGEGLGLADAGRLTWSANGDAMGGTRDVGLVRNAASVLKVTDGSSGLGGLLGGISELSSTSAASAGLTAKAFDNVSGSPIAEFARADGVRMLALRNHGGAAIPFEFNPDKALMQGNAVTFWLYQFGGVAFRQSHTGDTLRSPYFAFTGNHWSGAVNTEVSASFDFEPTYSAGGKFRLSIDGNEGLCVFRHENRLPVVQVAGATFTDASLNVQPNWTGKVGVAVRAQSGQTANLQEWQSSTGGIMAQLGVFTPWAGDSTPVLRMLLNNASASGNNVGGVLGFAYEGTERARVASQVVGGGFRSNLSFWTTGASGVLTNRMTIKDEGNIDWASDVPYTMQSAPNFDAKNTVLRLRAETTGANCSPALSFGVVSVSGQRIDTDSAAVRAVKDNNSDAAFAVGLRFQTFSGGTAGGTLSDKLWLSGAGDLELLTAAKGLILASPDGTRYRLTVDNAGVLSTAAA